MSGRLEGKVAIVTGAGRGIGRAIALAYGREGAAVGCIARTAADIKGTAEETVRAGGRALAIPANVRDLHAVETAFDESDPEAWRETRSCGGIHESGVWTSGNLWRMVADTSTRGEVR